MKAILSMIMSGAGYMAALAILVISGGVVALAILVHKMGDILLSLARKLWGVIKALLGEKEAKVEIN